MIIDRDQMYETLLNRACDWESEFEAVENKGTQKLDIKMSGLKDSSCSDDSVFWLDTLYDECSNSNNDLYKEKFILENKREDIKIMRLNEGGKTVNKIIADVYVFEWDKLIKKWEGVEGKSSRGVEFKTSDDYLRDNSKSPEDDEITIVVDVRKQINLPVKEKEDKE